MEKFANDDEGDDDEYVVHWAKSILRQNYYSTMRCVFLYKMFLIWI